MSDEDRMKVTDEEWGPFRMGPAEKRVTEADLNTARPVTVSEAAKAMAAPRRSFSIGFDGSMSFTGYNAVEVEYMLKIYREHLAALAQMAKDHPLPGMTGGGYQ